jgi:hypothetical protein
MSVITYLNLNYFNIYHFRHGNKKFFAELLKPPKSNHSIHQQHLLDIALIEQTIHSLQSQQKVEEQKEELLEHERLQEIHREHEARESENAMLWISQQESDIKVWQLHLLFFASKFN